MVPWVSVTRQVLWQCTDDSLKSGKALVGGHTFSVKYPVYSFGHYYPKAFKLSLQVAVTCISVAVVMMHSSTKSLEKTLVEKYLKKSFAM